MAEMLIILAILGALGVGAVVVVLLIVRATSGPRREVKTSHGTFVVEGPDGEFKDMLVDALEHLDDDSPGDE